MQECKNARMQECENAGMQECENARMQECENAGMVKQVDNLGGLQEWLVGPERNEGIIL